MNDLDKELKGFGFSREFIASINKAEVFEDYDIKIENPDYQSYVNETTSSAELEVNQAPTTGSNYLIDNDN